MLTRLVGGHGTLSAARVVVGVSGSPGSLTVLGRAADEAWRRGAELWPVPAWEPPGEGRAARRSSAAAVMVEEWEQTARERSIKALCDAFDSGALAVPGQALVAPGTPGRPLVQTADRENDLLVIGTGRQSRLHRTLWPSVGRC